MTFGWFGAPLILAKPVPNCLGLGAEQSGTGDGPVSSVFGPKAGPTPSKTGPVIKGGAGKVKGYSMLRNSGSGPEIGLPGRILAGPLPGNH